MPKRMPLRALVAVVVLAMSVTGCGGYKLAGNVIEGPQAAVLVVDADDPRLSESGIGGVSLRFMVDPQSLGTKPLGETISEGNGRFSMPVQELGAGLLEYRISLTAKRSGYQTLYREMMLPGGNRRLLIVMASGRGGDALPDRTDLNQELEQALPLLDP